MITRFAPTPSGYLHLGNAAHLVLLAELAEDSDWQIALRIDDIDPDRTKPEYVDDILGLIEWLDIPITGDTRWQSRHRADYVAARDALMDRGAYVCACSRTQWADHQGPGCPSGCTGLELIEGHTTLRMRLTDTDDIVIWRREGIPAYHLASVVDDDVMSVTHIVRGADLHEATRVQRILAERLPGSTFGAVEAIHHRLIEDPAGVKLSKSAGVRAEPLPRTVETRAQIEQSVRILKEGLTTVRP